MTNLPVKQPNWIQNLLVKVSLSVWFLTLLCFICLTTGEFIASGSDDGRWFIWEKRTGRLIKMLAGDGTGNYISTSFSDTFLILLLMCFTFSIVVNCIQSHPFDCAVATSGIDNTIKVYNLYF